MLVKLKGQSGYKDIEVRHGSRVIDLAKTVQKDFEHRILLARVNNYYTNLNERLNQSDRVELMDMTDHAVELVYQDSLFLVFIAAVNKIFPGTRIEIANSLNQGMYIDLVEHKPVDEGIVDKIKSIMDEMIDEDLPFVKEVMKRDEAVEILEEQGGVKNTIELINEDNRARTVIMNRIDGYWQVASGCFLPSAGYIEHYDIRKYKKGILLRYPNRHNPEKIPDYVDQKKLYEAFAKQTKWNNLLGVNYVHDLNRNIKNGNSLELIQLSEALQEKEIAQIADMIRSEGRRIVLVAGPSSSGKTTFAKRLAVQLRVNGIESLCLGTDDYFVEREDTPFDENGERNYENLDAIDRELFNSNMNALLAGEEVDLPKFNFITGKKEYGKRITSIADNTCIIIEGIHALNERLTSKIDKNSQFRIYISPLTQLNIDEHNRVPTTDERLIRRLVRDYQFRGHGAAATIQDWPKVRNGEDRNIFPYSDEADVLFNSHHVYELAVLKKYALPLLEQISPNEPEYAEANRLLDFLKPFDEIEDDSVIVNNSILREFIGGSVFVE